MRSEMQKGSVLAETMAEQQTKWGKYRGVMKL